MSIVCFNKTLFTLLNEAAGHSTEQWGVTIWDNTISQNYTDLTLLDVKQGAIFILFNSYQILCVMANFYSALTCVKHCSRLIAHSVLITTRRSLK